MRLDDPELVRAEYEDETSRDAAQAYVDAGLSISGSLPPVEGPVRVRRTPVIFVAEKA